MNLNSGQLLLVEMVRPTLEHGSEVLESNMVEVAALESVVFGGYKHILGYLSATSMKLSEGGEIGLFSYVR